MKKIFILGALAFAQPALYAQSAKTVMAAAPAAATTWNLDHSHSNVRFTVDHMVISEVEGTFNVFNGKISAPNPDFNGAQIEFSVDATSINTNNEKRDAHLKSEEFFHTDKFPEMKFKSTSFKKVKDNAYVLEGDMTIKGITKKVQFAVVFGGTVKDNWGNIKAGFKANGTINRKEFGLSWGPVTEAGGAVVGDDVRMQINVQFAQAKG